MPYYMAGDYYGRGDYYQAGGNIFKSLAGLAKKALGFTPLAAVSNLLPPFKDTRQMLPPRPQTLPVLREPGVKGFVHRLVPGGSTGYEVQYGGLGGRRHRRINPLNIKALRRAMRRAKSFERQARRVGSFFHPGKSYRLKGRRPRAKS
jgi:hypothetical protein